MSVYSWQGKIETTEEYQLQIKSNSELYSEIEKEIVSIHSYDTPEIISTPIINVSKDYLSWMKENTRH